MRTQDKMLDPRLDRKRQNAEFHAKHGVQKELCSYTDQALHRRLDTLEHKLDLIIKALEIA